jgi:hypothetical protein
MALARYINRVDDVLGTPDLPSEIADLLGDYYDLLSALDDAFTVPGERKPSGRKIEALVWETLGLDGAP